MTRIFRVLMVLVGFFTAPAAFAWDISIGGVDFGSETTINKSPLCQFIDGATESVGTDRRFEYVFRRSGDPLVVVKVSLKLFPPNATDASWGAVVEVARPTMRMLTDNGYRLIGNRCEGLSLFPVVTITIE